MGLFHDILFVLQKYISAHIETKNHYANDGFCVPRKGSGALRAEVSKTASCRPFKKNTFRTNLRSTLWYESGTRRDNYKYNKYIYIYRHAEGSSCHLRIQGHPLSLDSPWALVNEPGKNSCGLGEGSGWIVLHVLHACHS